MWWAYFTSLWNVHYYSRIVCFHKAANSHMWLLNTSNWKFKLSCAASAKHISDSKAYVKKMQSLNNFYTEYILKYCSVCRIDKNITSLDFICLNTLVTPIKFNLLESFNVTYFITQHWSSNKRPNLGINSNQKFLDDKKKLSTGLELLCFREKKHASLLSFCCWGA